ncbi:heme-binding domain-containing protein [Seonamhaeicola marinus]|uniref:Cytochrome C n=1 Tax=Seonamhaeicola marinus TaxID=1912246 RepID=A0A5D0HN49_9FLAO|nr:heme-binding domain-containing protein [Seonamhaeicola marinus]TYA71467.1 cytochrome C [Seonamhaeicola marinus]
MKIVKKILLVLVLALVLLQFYRPDKNNAETRNITAFIEDTKPTKEVSAILEKYCYDCHSNKTTYPWYAEVAPVSLWVNHHVEEGKEHFDVSNWSAYKVKKRDHKLDELIEEVEEGKMPLDSYTWLHGSMSEEEKETLINWAKGVRANYKL